MAQAHEDEDSMSISDDDGGVRLDMTVAQSSPAMSLPAHESSQPHKHVAAQPATSSSVAPYDSFISLKPYQASRLHQDTTLFAVPGSCLWQVPIVHGDMIGKPADNAEAIHRKACHLIRSNWGLEPGNALPGLVRDSTPYSLAMLLQIRTLASHSKRDMLYAHAVLVEQWTMRVAELGITAPTDQRSVIITDTSRVQGLGNPEGMKHCEPSIQENIYGLMLEDVSRAWPILQQKKFQASGQKKQAKLERKLANDELLTTKEARKLGRVMTVADYAKGHRVTPNGVRYKVDPMEAGTPPEPEVSERRQRFLRRRAEKDKKFARKVNAAKTPSNRTDYSQAMEAEGLRSEDIRAVQASTHHDVSVPADMNMYAAQDAPTLEDVRKQRKRSRPARVPSVAAELLGDEEGYAGLSRKERRDLNDVTIMLDLQLSSNLRDDRTHRVYSQHHTPRPRPKGKKSRWQKLERAQLTALEERKQAGAKTLPFERSDFASMPGLYASENGVREVTEGVRELELAKLGQQPLPSLAEGLRLDLLGGKNEPTAR